MDLEEKAKAIGEWLGRRHEDEEAAIRRIQRVVWLAWWKANGPAYLAWAVITAAAIAYFVLA